MAEEEQEKFTAGTQMNNTTNLQHQQQQQQQQLPDKPKSSSQSHLYPPSTASQPTAPIFDQTNGLTGGDPNISAPQRFFQPTLATGHRYLFAPPYFQPHFLTSNFDDKFQNTAELTPKDVVAAQNRDNAAKFKPMNKCCGVDYIDYTTLRFLFTMRQLMGVIAVVITGFAVSNIWPTFYLVFPLFLLSTTFTVGQSLVGLYTNFIALFLALAINYFLFRYLYPVSSLTVGLAIPIAIFCVAILLTTKVHPVLWKIFTTFYPVFLLIGWVNKHDHIWVLNEIEMCAISLAFSIAIVMLPYPLQANHHVDNLVRKLLRNSSRITYLSAKAFLQERYNKSHLIDYASTRFEDTDALGLNTKIKGRNRVKGTLFEPHLKGLQRYNQQKRTQKLHKRHKRDVKLKELGQDIAQPASESFSPLLSRSESLSPTSPLPQQQQQDQPQSCATQQPTPPSVHFSYRRQLPLPHRQISADMYHDLHHQGGHSLYVESYSDALSSTSTDEDLCFHVEGSSVSGESVLGSSTASEDDGSGDESQGPFSPVGNNPNVPFSGMQSFLPGAEADDHIYSYYNSSMLPNAHQAMYSLEPAVMAQKQQSTNNGLSSSPKRQNKRLHPTNLSKTSIASNVIDEDSDDDTDTDDDDDDDHSRHLSIQVGGIIAKQTTTNDLSTLPDPLTKSLLSETPQQSVFPSHFHDGVGINDDIDIEEDEEIHDTPFFDDLYAHFGRKYAPEHPQSSIRVKKDIKTNTNDPETKTHHFTNNQQFNPQAESDVNLHVPYPQMYLNRLLDVVVEMETDLETLRTHVTPLKYEGIAFRLIAFLLCCCCRSYKVCDMDPLSTHAFTGLFHGPTAAHNVDKELDHRRQGGFYPQPHFIYPNIFTSTRFLSQPYNTESLNTFISEMLLAITNVRGMVNALGQLSALSKGGLMLYHFWASFIRHDMKRLVWFQKAYINNIINHNEDLRAMDSSFIHSLYTISSQFVDDNSTMRSSAETSAPSSPTSITRSLSTQTTDALRNQKRNRGPAPAHNQTDVFTSLYIALTKYKVDSVKPSEKDVRRLSFVPGSYAGVLHQFRNMWLQSSRIRQAAFYGIRKTKFKKISKTIPLPTHLTSTTLGPLPSLSSPSPHPPRPKILSSLPLHDPTAIQTSPGHIDVIEDRHGEAFTHCHYVLRTRKITDPIFNFATTISQRYAPVMDQIKTPVYNHTADQFKDHDVTILQSPFAQLYSPHESKVVNRRGWMKQQGPAVSAPQTPLASPFPESKRARFQTPQTTPYQPHQRHHHQQPHETQLGTHAKTTGLRHKKEKEHFQISLEDVVLFNNYFFNFDRYHSRLINVILPTVTNHLYPLALVTTTGPSSLSIQHNINTISSSSAQHSQLLNDTLVGAKLPPINEANLPSPEPSLSGQPPPPPPPPTSNYPTPLRATILKPASIPSWYTLPPPIISQYLIDFFIPNIAIWFWNVISIIIFPQITTNLPQHDLSVIKTQLDQATPLGAIELNLDINIQATAPSIAKSPDQHKDQTPVVSSRNVAQRSTAQNTDSLHQVPTLELAAGYENNDDDGEDEVVEINLDEETNEGYETPVQLEGRSRLVANAELKPFNQLVFEPLHLSALSPPEGRQDPETNQNRHFHHQEIVYTPLTFFQRVQKAWILHIRPGPAELRYYKFLWRNIICITVVNFFVLIPSPIQRTHYVHWPTLSTALLMGDVVGFGSSFTAVMNAVIAQIIGAFFSLILIKFALAVDDDDNIKTGLAGYAVLTCGLALLTGYFSWVRSSRTKNTTYAASLIVVAFVISLGSLGNQTDQQVLYRIEAYLFSCLIVILGTLFIFPARGVNGLYAMLSLTLRGLSSLLEFNSHLLTQSTLFQYTHGSFNSFGPTFFPIVPLGDEKTIEFDLTEDEYQEIVAEAPQRGAGGKSSFEALRRKVMLLDRIDDKIYEHAAAVTRAGGLRTNGPAYHAPSSASNQPTSPFILAPLPFHSTAKLPDYMQQDQGQMEPTFRTKLQIYHPFDSRSQFFHNCITIFTRGSMDPASIGLRLVPYPPRPRAELNGAYNRELVQQLRNYATVRHTNYLNFLFVYNAQIKARSAELRTLGLALNRSLSMVENESIVSLIGSVKKEHLGILASVFGTVFVLIRLMNRVHELLYCYQFLLISTNEYYNLTGCDMNSSFKSIIQLNYETHIQQKQHKLQIADPLQQNSQHQPQFTDGQLDLNNLQLDEHTGDEIVAHQKQHRDASNKNNKNNRDLTSFAAAPSTTMLSSRTNSSNHTPRHFHDDLAFENQDLTTLLINHTQDILHRTIPQMSQVDQFIHLKTKTLQINKMLMAECLPLFISFNHTMSLLLNSTIKTTNSLLERTLVPTTLTFAFSLSWAKPVYHTHNNVQYQLFRSHKERLLNQKKQKDEATFSEQEALLEDDIANARVCDPDDRNAFDLFCEDEAEYLNTPYARGCFFTIFGFTVGPCCLRRTKYGPIKKSPDDDQDGVHVSAQFSGDLKTPVPKKDSSCDVEMGKLEQTQPRSPAPIKSSPKSSKNQRGDISYPNPFFDRSTRLNQQRHCVFELIAYLRQVKFIFQEITYQRFYGGRDGYYSAHPTPLVNIEHSFLATIGQCPAAFIDLISQLSRLDLDQ